MRNTIIKSLIVATTAVLAVGACGAGENTTVTEGKDVSTVVIDKSSEMFEDAAEAARLRAYADECEQLMSPLIDELDSIDAQLDIGMTQSEYNSALGLASVAYNSIDYESAEMACLVDVGQHLEKAFSLYVDANELWDDCIWDYGCSNDAIEPDLQEKWSKAHRKINAAHAGLEDMATVGEPTGSST